MIRRNTEVKKEVRSFYERYPCGGNSVDLRPKRHKICPWMFEVFEYDKWDGNMLLEVGCGTGIDMALYCAHGATVIGIDLAEKPLRIAKRRFYELGLGEKAYFIRCDLENMPIKERSFNMAYCIGVLHHTPNPVRGAVEIHRVLKKGGKAIILLYHMWSISTIITKLNRIFYRLFSDYLILPIQLLLRRKLSPSEEAGLREMWQHPLIRYFTHAQAKHTFKNVGFQVLTKGYDTMYPVSRFLPSITKRDILKNFLGRFIIAKCEKRI